MNIIPSLRIGRFVAAIAPQTEHISSLIAELALRGSVTVLDSGNRFAAYRIAQLIRRRSLEVERISKRIFVRRAFTCYQVISLLEDTPALPQPYVILDPLSTFNDDQVSILERRRLLNICLKEIERLRLAAPVAVSLSSSLVDEKSFLVDELCARADEIFTLEAPPVQEEMQLSLFQA